MSNALAIAHVTQALALLIENDLPPEIDIAVSVETRKPYSEPPTDPTITVFLYQVTPNAALRNDDVPTRAPDGTLIRRAAAAVDLHYVISAYGEENELVGQRLIGSVVRTLHEIPVLPAAVIEAAGERPHLAGSDLAESAQRVRFTPTQLDIDETSKLWGMLHQTPYALSVAYRGSLVRIEGRERPALARPVERRTVRALPFGAPGAPPPPGGGAGDGGPGDGGAPDGARPPAGGGAEASAAVGGRTPSKKAARAPRAPKAARRTTTARGGAAPKRRARKAAEAGGAGADGADAGGDRES